MTMDWQEEVYAALNTIPDINACFMYPEEWPQGTVVTYSRLDERPAVNADDNEYLTEIVAKADVWDNDPDTVRRVVKLVKAKLREIGFHCTYCMDLFEPESRLHHTTMRFFRVN